MKISKEEFFDLTPYEFSVLLEYHNKSEKDYYSILRNVIYNAGLNLMRKKGAKEISLFDEKEEKEIESISDIETRKKEREELFNSFK